LPSPRATIDTSNAEELVRACVAHLLSLLDGSGRFVYAHRFMHPEEALSGYNLLRHCGTVWFMCKAIRTLGIEPSADEKQRLRSALGFIQALTREPTWAGEPARRLCLTSDDVVKLGGVGLSALMIREYAVLEGTLHQEPLVALYPGGPETTLTGLENYLVSQLEGDDFIHKRTFSTGAVHPFRSAYYTGEALFALMRSSRQVPRIRTAMEKLLDADYGLPQQSHWMAYAACASIKVGYCDEKKTAAYIARLLDSIVSDEAYRERHDSTPIACRTEALVEILQTHQAGNYLTECLPQSAVDAATTAATENLNLQLEYYGAGQFKGGRTSDTVQIDYIQHNGASFLGWWELAS
jgi:hypothetical protein